MSLTDEITGVAVKSLEKIADDLATEFLGKYAHLLDAASPEVLEKVDGILLEAARFKMKSLTAKTVKDAKDYAEAVETAARRVKVVLLTEGVVAGEALADAIMTGLLNALGVLGDVAKGVLQAVASGMVTGVVKGFVAEGGEMPDPTDVFPWG